MCNVMLQADVLEEALLNPNTLLSIEDDETAGYDSSHQGETDYWPLCGTEVNTGASGRNNTVSGKMNSQQKMLPQQYCLRWKYHHNNLQVMFSQLLERESFCDVTLACEGKTLRAHKVSTDPTFADAGVLITSLKYQAGSVCNINKCLKLDHGDGQINACKQTAYQ